jgi:hypothetical protein
MDERRRRPRNGVRMGWREPHGPSSHARGDGDGYPPWGWRDMPADGGESTAMGYGPGGEAYRMRGGAGGDADRDTDRDRPDPWTAFQPEGIARWSSAGERSQSHRGLGPRGYRRADERILEDVCDRLTDDPEVDASDVEVSVKEGEVTLEGSVDERRIKWLAEEIASRCLGVVDVHNHLRVARRRREEQVEAESEPRSRPHPRDGR